MSGMDSCVEDIVARIATDAEAHAAVLSEKRSGHAGNEALIEWAREAMDHHRSQMALWSTLVCLASSKGSELLVALDNGKYPPLPASELLALRPDPPGGRDAPATADYSLLNGKEVSAAEEYQSVREQLGKAREYNILSGQMQTKVSRRMHAVPALGNVTLPKNTAVHLSATSSVAAREIVASQVEQAAPNALRPGQQAVLSASGARAVRASGVREPATQAAAPWNAELGGLLAARQQAKSAEETNPRPVAENAGLSSSSDDAMANELAAVLARRIASNNPAGNAGSLPREAAALQGRASLPPTNQMTELQAAMERRRRNSGV